MDAKGLYFGALDAFSERNTAVMPQIQLRFGRVEKWFVPEFVAAMNTSISGEPGPSELATFADTEYRNIDICVWEPSDQELPAAIFEAKVLFTGDNPQGFVDKACHQLNEAPLSADRKIGLFVVVVARECAATGSCEHGAEIRKQLEQARTAIRSGFESDHNIRMTELTALTQIRYPKETWHTQSWLTWGYRKSA